MDTMTVTGTAMLNDVERLRLISHNLANLATVGFKREIAVARPFLDHLEKGSLVSASRPLLTSYSDHSMGALKHTGSPLDVALEGAGFFAVATEWGEAYTRQGNFQLDADGRLMTAGGYPVLGAGGEIRVNTPQPRIDQAGNVWDGANVIARLKVVETADPNSLERVGNGLFSATAWTEVTEAEATRVRQGYLEVANVTSMNEMIKMIETMRHFETSQKLLRGYDNMLDRAINVIGEM